jgi:hypothetical protein
MANFNHNSRKYSGSPECQGVPDSSGIATPTSGSTASSWFTSNPILMMDPFLLGGNECNQSHEIQLLSEQNHMTLFAFPFQDDSTDISVKCHEPVKLYLLPVHISDKQKYKPA